MLACLFCWLGLAAPSLTAQQDERAVRAAYLFNLTRYVSWPGGRKQIVIGVAGNDNRGAELKSLLENKISDGRQIVVLLHPGESEIRSCDVLYVPAGAQTNWQALAGHIAGHPILTVGETSQFSRRGGMVGLIRSGDQIQIEVNLEVVRASGLNISSHLLNLAVLVRAAGVKR